MTREDFLELFPTDGACLGYLKDRCYPDGTECRTCLRRSRFHPIRGRTAYSCQFCGAHVYPTAGTVFHRSRTGLQKWFWAIYLVSSTQGRITPGALRQELAVSDGTARRMLGQIRAALPDLPVPAEASVPPEPPETSPPPPPQPPAWHRTRRRG